MESTSHRINKFLSGLPLPCGAFMGKRVKYPRCKPVTLAPCKVAFEKFSSSTRYSVGS